MIPCDLIAIVVTRVGWQKIMASGTMVLNLPLQFSRNPRRFLIIVIIKSLQNLSVPTLPVIYKVHELVAGWIN